MNRSEDIFEIITYKFWIDFHEEIVLEEHEANDGEHVDEDEGEHRCQDDGTTVAGHRPDDVQKRLFSVNHIKQLQRAWFNNLTLVRGTKFTKTE